MNYHWLLGSDFLIPLVLASVVAGFPLLVYFGGRRRVRRLIDRAEDLTDDVLFLIQQPGDDRVRSRLALAGDGFAEAVREVLDANPSTRSDARDWAWRVAQELHYVRGEALLKIYSFGLLPSVVVGWCVPVFGLVFVAGLAISVLSWSQLQMDDLAARQRLTALFDRILAAPPRGRPVQRSGPTA